MARKLFSVVIIVALVMAGAVGVYFFTTFTSPQTGSSTTTGSSTSTGTAAGYQIASQPYGVWSDYLGYIPKGYTPAPHGVNAPTFNCPAGMSTSACDQFKGTCGNGVCDPNESCSTCPIDCAPSGDQTCDPYTGRAGAPVSICFVA